MSDQLSLFGADPAPEGPLFAGPGEAPASDQAPQPASGEAPGEIDADRAARQFAADPLNNVVLEASAGTGKTTVLVSRYVNLLARGVDPANILAITFTRKAAAEMRERIIRELRRAAEQSAFDPAQWTALRDRLADIQISTIDAFCLSLLREFPLEADLDPGFDIADETEVPWLVDQSLDKSLAIFIGLAKREPEVALVLAQLGIARTREGLAYLLQRRLVAGDALDRFLARAPANLSPDEVCARAVRSLMDVLGGVACGLPVFLDEGPVGHPRYQMLARDLRRLESFYQAGNAAVRGLVERVAAHFLTSEGKRRVANRIHPYNAEQYLDAAAGKRHRAAALELSGPLEDVVRGFNRDLNAVLTRGVRRMFVIALAEYRRALDGRSVLDFSDVLERAIALLRRMDEFSQSRYRLESRYHHVLVDEFQDTSRAQWQLVSLLVEAWGQGLGVATQPSIFIVGDRKQSIYRFRDAEVAVLQEAGRHIEGLRPGSTSRRAITRSFRAVPELLAFVNDVFTEMGREARRPDDFKYDAADRFPIVAVDDPRGPALGIAVADEPTGCAPAVAEEIARILRDDTVRDRQTGGARRARPGDVAVLFRSRASHREFEHELEARGIPAYVYKGLGFFDADEIKDIVALIRFLANPTSDLRAAAFLRSRFIRLSDSALAALAPRLAAAITDAPPAALDALEQADRRTLLQARAQVPGWIARVDRVPPADLIEEILPDSAYAIELRGGRRAQAWENLKKMRGLVRRIQNRGYATLARIADHLESLTAGDESNAVLEALEAVNLMTVHAAKGLEYPIVFIVNLAKGASGAARPVRVVAGDDEQEPSVAVGPFVSESDEEERIREREETKRLLYVALTRARDRLYLSSSLKEGKLAPGRGSLAEVLPDTLRALFTRAATSFDAMETLAWSGESGRSFEFRRCRQPAPDATPAASRAADLDAAAQARDRFEAVVDPAATERLSVTRWLDGQPSRDPVFTAEPEDALVGTLVHRLFQFGAYLATDLPDHDGLAFTRSLIRPEELAVADNVEALIARAVNAWTAMRIRPEVNALLASGERLHEVPFSVRLPGDAPRVLRGTIDCLIRRPDGAVTVVEFKTGARRPSHRAQVELYVEAAQAMYPGAQVDGRLVYPI